MINCKVFFLSLSAVTILAALLGLVEIWLFLFPWMIFLKIMGTLLVIGVLCAFLAAINFDLLAKNQKILLFLMAGLSLLCSLLSCAQIWFQPLEWPLFLKLLASTLIAIALPALLAIIGTDCASNKHLEENNFID